jgi:hypothetical protein
MNLYNLLILLLFGKHNILPITSKVKLKKYNTTKVGFDMTKNDSSYDINFKEMFYKKKLLDKLTSNISMIEKQLLIVNNEIYSIKPFNLSINSLLRTWYYDL